jgi:hypothetical protein
VRRWRVRRAGGCLAGVAGDYPAAAVLQVGYA